MYETLEYNPKQGAFDYRTGEDLPPAFEWYTICGSIYCSKAERFLDTMLLKYPYPEIRFHNWKDLDFLDVPHPTLEQVKEDFNQFLLDTQNEVFWEWDKPEHKRPFSISSAYKQAKHEIARGRNLEYNVASVYYFNKVHKYEDAIGIQLAYADVGIELNIPETERDTHEWKFIKEYYQIDDLLSMF